MKKTILKWSLGLALAPLGLAFAPHALAQTQIDQRKPASPDGLVDIENAAGSVKVIGWNRDEVQVIGSLSARADGLEFVSRPGRTRIQVETGGNPNKVVSNLEVHVPAGSRVQVQSYSAAIEVSEVSGRVKAESVSGAVTITGGAAEVEAESVSGAVSITAPAKRVRASAVNGSLVIRGASGVVDAETVNGKLELSGGVFQEARLETVNGPIRFEGDLPSGATLAVETVNGSVDLRLPASLAADFSISSFQGDVDSEFEMKLVPGSRSGRGGSPPHGPGRHDDHKKPGKKAKGDDDDHDDESDEHQGRELRFTTGGGGAKIGITTLNGRITLRKR